MSFQNSHFEEMQIPEGWHKVYVYSRLETDLIVEELERIIGKDNFYLKEIDNEEWLIVTEEPITDAEHRKLNERAFEYLVSEEDRDDPDALRRLWEKVPPYPGLPMPKQSAGTRQKSNSDGTFAFLRRLIMRS